ncbi:hypothetical protein Tco_0062165, partial [Tanacetum coccineum]
VLDLEKAKSDQAIEIASLKKRVDKLEKRRKFRTTWLKRLKKVGAARRIESSNDKRQDEDLMFDTGVLDDDEVFVDVITVEKDSAAPTDEQSTKTGEAVTTAGVEDSAAPTIPITEEQVTMSTVSITQPSIKDKGKGIMQEPERPLKRKDQVALDEQMARDLQAQLEAELIEEEKKERQKQEEANMALIES